MPERHLRDLPNFIRTTNPDDYMIKCVLQERERSKNASAIIINTFEPSEKEVLESLQTFLPPVYAIGLLHLLVKHVDHKNLEDLGSNLWKEDEKCLEWLDSKKPNYVAYVNLGSLIVMSLNQLIKFAWVLANSQLEFLWTIRHMLASWCPQEQVLVDIR
uniref:7-deoxyloganetin glucosyltransferase-like n=1 Tax=Nicotiana sylvestris TaxID=4096 RepID=A0A1U7X090_NICSY|nr:PREDICTED: 7-deoxyloganetin glucosyltransferase-like [Nicotiana sylvestris]